MVHGDCKPKMWGCGGTFVQITCPHAAWRMLKQEGGQKEECLCVWGGNSMCAGRVRGRCGAEAESVQLKQLWVQDGGSESWRDCRSRWEETVCVGESEAELWGGAGGGN